MKKLFIFIFILSACSSSQIHAETTPLISNALPVFTLTSPATSSPQPSNTPLSTVTPPSSSVTAGMPSWPTQTALPKIQAGKSFVLSQIDMIDENAGWGHEATGHLLRTTDGGATWRDVTPPEAGYFYVRDEIHAWNVVATRIFCEQLGCSVDWTPGLAAWQTSDGGQTWQRGAPFVGGAPEPKPITMQFASNTTGWLLLLDQVGMSGFTYESLAQTLDGGESWQLIQSFSDGCISGGMRFFDEQNGLIGDDCRRLSNTMDGITLQDFLQGRAAPSLNRTMDGGKTWNAFPVPAPTVFPANFTSGDLDPNTWFYCGITQMEKISREAFLLQWNCKTAHSTTYTEASYAYLTPDGGQTWRSWLATGNENFITPITGWRLLTQDTGQGNSLQQTVDGGLTWNTLKTVGWQTAQFDFVNDQAGWAIVGDGMTSALVHTADGGKTWTELNPLISNE